MWNDILELLENYMDIIRSVITIRSYFLLIPKMAMVTVVVTYADSITGDTPDKMKQKSPHSMAHILQELAVWNSKVYSSKIYI